MFHSFISLSPPTPATPPFLTARPWAERGSCFTRGFFNRAAMGRARFMFYPGFFFNRAAMGRARFMFYPWVFFFRRFVGDQTQTSLGQTSNDATYGVYSCKEYTANL